MGLLSLNTLGPAAQLAAVKPASTTISLSDLIVPALQGLVDPGTSPINVAKGLASAFGDAAAKGAADVAVPDGVETLARLVGADKLLGQYGPGKAIATVTKPLLEKIVLAPIMNGCMAVLAKYSTVLSCAVTAITALQVGVAAAACIGVGYALYKFFNRESTTSPA